MTLHLLPGFGALKLRDVTVERIERYLADKRRGGYSAASLNRQLNVLSLVLGEARRRGLVRVNAVADVDRPREPRRRWRILSPAETTAVEKEPDALIEEATNDRDRDDRIVARRLFITHMGAAIRRGEAAGLRWRSVRGEATEGAADPLR